MRFKLDMVSHAMFLHFPADWELERRQLHDIVVPQLQREWSSVGVDIQLVDIQNGGEEDGIIAPGAIAGQIRDIEDCHKSSLGCFFLVKKLEMYWSFACIFCSEILNEQIHLFSFSKFDLLSSAKKKVH